MKGKKCSSIETEILLSQTIEKTVASNIIVKCFNCNFGLLYLCYPFYKDLVYEVKKTTHNNFCLTKFCNIREYILNYRNKINWIGFVNIINETKIGNQIFYSLWLVDSFYGDLNIEDILSKINITEKYVKDNLNWESMLL